MYETSHALDVLWSYSADDAMDSNEPVNKFEGNKYVGEWRNLGRLSLSRVVQDDRIRPSRRYATMVGDVKPCWGAATWVQNAIFVSGGIKAVLPLFAHFGTMRSKKVILNDFENAEKEDDSEKQNELYTEVMLLLRGFMFGSGGLGCEKFTKLERLQ